MQIIDTHAHWYPREFIALLDREAASNGAKMERNEKGVPVFSLPGVLPHSAMPPLMVEPELILQEMDKRGIETYVLSLTNPMVYWAPPAFGLKLAQTWNDASSAVCQKHPGRFIGTIQLPMQAPELTAKELERAAKLPGLRVVYLATHVNGRTSTRRRSGRCTSAAKGWGCRSSSTRCIRAAATASESISCATCAATRTRTGSPRLRSCSAASWTRSRSWK